MKSGNLRTRSPTKFKSADLAISPRKKKRQKRTQAPLVSSDPEIQKCYALFIEKCDNTSTEETLKVKAALWVLLKKIYLKIYHGLESLKLSLEPRYLKSLQSYLKHPDIDIRKLVLLIITTRMKFEKHFRRAWILQFPNSKQLMRIVLSAHLGEKVSPSLDAAGQAFQYNQGTLFFAMNSLFQNYQFDEFSLGKVVVTRKLMTVPDPATHYIWFDRAVNKKIQKSFFQQPTPGLYPIDCPLDHSQGLKSSSFSDKNKSQKGRACSFQIQGRVVFDRNSKKLKSDLTNDREDGNKAVFSIVMEEETTSPLQQNGFGSKRRNRRFSIESLKEVDKGQPAPFQCLFKQKSDPVKVQEIIDKLGKKSTQNSNKLRSPLKSRRQNHFRLNDSKNLGFSSLSLAKSKRKYQESYSQKPKSKYQKYVQTLFKRLDNGSSFRIENRKKAFALKEEDVFRSSFSVKQR